MTKMLSARQLAVGVAGYCTFINLYSPQAILPMLSQEFGAGPAEISSIVTASTLSVALTAPFTGAIADVLGRKRVIVVAMFALALTTVAVALAPNLHALVIARFVQGLVMPPVFAVTIAYIGDEWEPGEAAVAAGIYSSGSSIGGFSGRFFAGVISDYFGWHAAFYFLALLTFAGAILMIVLLPREKRFVRSEGLTASIKQMIVNLRNPQLIAIYAVGFGVLFNFICTFTYISFRLADAPYNMSASALGAIFVVYLVGSAMAPWSGWAISRYGRRRFMMRVIALWIAGILLTLAGPLWCIIGGLTACAACGLLCQAISTGYVTITAKEGRSSAVGLYVMSFYIGGSFGSAVGGAVWNVGQWPACVALTVFVLAIMAYVIWFGWTPRVPAEKTPGPIEPP